MKIKIPFNTWSREKLEIGCKCATSRNKQYGNLGDTFEVDETVFKIDLILRLPLWFVKDCLYLSEGCENPHEFFKVWCDIHPRKGFVPHQLVWYHHFKEITDEKGR
jgi:hypothetical protein